VLLSICALAMLNCGAENATPLELEFGLRSYDSFAKLQKLVEASDGTWEIIERNIPEENRGAPQFEVIRVSTSAFNLQENEGETVALFYNSKLTSLTFYPFSWESFVSTYVSKQYGNIEKFPYSLLLGKEKITLAEDFYGRKFIKFEDILLEAEIQAWISRYS